MEIKLYNYVLVASLSLMLFFSYRFIFGQLPKTKYRGRYLQSRRLMGFAMLVLSVNYMIHFVYTPRRASDALAIVINLCTYWIAVTLFGSAMMTLLEKERVTRRRVGKHVAAWVVYCLLAVVMWYAVPEGLPCRVMLFVLDALFVLYALKVVARIFVTFQKIRRRLDNYYADDKRLYVRWMSVITYWALSFGLGQSGFTLLPRAYLIFWMISAIPFYVYLYTSYANYYLFYEYEDGLVAKEDPEVQPDPVAETAVEGMSKQQETALSRRLAAWVEQKGFTAGGLTIEDVARATGTNRTYVSSFINTRYGVTFREWINGLRLDYAKQLMTAGAGMPVSEVARLAGYLSLSYFTKTFKDNEGVTPGKWARR